jgi:hypothetical protein
MAPIADARGDRGTYPQLSRSLLHGEVEGAEVAAET